MIETAKVVILSSISRQSTILAIFCNPWIEMPTIMHGIRDPGNGIAICNFCRRKWRHCVRTFQVPTWHCLQHYDV